MTYTRLATAFFANVLGMAATFFPEIPFIIAALLWAYGLGTLVTHIALYTSINN